MDADMNMDREWLTTNNDVNHPHETVANEQKHAGFWIRFLAYIIDVIIIGCIDGILTSPLLFVNEGIPLKISFWTLNGILATVIYYGYFILFTKFFQQTLGKMIVGIYVIHTENEQLGWGDVFFRECIGRIIHNVFLVLKLLYLAVAISKEKQGLHDMIANTKVVYVNRS